VADRRVFVWIASRYQTSTSYPYKITFIMSMGLSCWRLLWLWVIVNVLDRCARVPKVGWLDLEHLTASNIGELEVVAWTESVSQMEGTPAIIGITRKEIRSFQAHKIVRCYCNHIQPILLRA